MADTTNIEWCDSTFNPWIGCTRVSPACDDCYAARSTPARTLGVVWGAGEPRRRTSAATWALPGRWQRTAAEFAAQHGGRRRRVFCASLADWLDNAVPMADFVDLMEVIRQAPDLDWLLLSKRIGNWQSRISEAVGFLDEQTPHAYPLPLRAWLTHWLDGDDAPGNVWMGATVVNQAEADRDVPKLLRTPAAVRFLSVEPMLGPVDLTGEWLTAQLGSYPFKMLPAQHRTKLVDLLDWVICGGESGPKARPMHPDWARNLRDQCTAAGVPFLFKQWGEWRPPYGAGLRLEDLVVSANPMHPVMALDKAMMTRVGKKAAGRLLDGRTHDEWPEVRHG